MVVHTFSPICILMWELGALLIWTLEYLFIFKISWGLSGCLCMTKMSDVAVVWWGCNTRLVSMEVVLWFQILLKIRISFQGISWWGVSTNSKYTNNLILLFIGKGRFVIYDQVTAINLKLLKPLEGMIWNTKILKEIILESCGFTNWSFIVSLMLLPSLEISRVVVAEGVQDELKQGSVRTRTVSKW